MPDFLIDQILRSNQVHLISGPSRSGKSTLLLQVLAGWAAGLPVFGHVSVPAPFALVSCDRSASTIDDTMLRLGMIPDTIPHFSIIDPPRNVFQRRESDRPSQDDHSISEILAICQRIVPNLACLFVDGLSTLCPGKIIDHRDVANFLRDTSRLCIQQRVTIVGTVYAAKSREGEGYAAPCDRMLGSGAWASHTGTAFILEPADRKRTLHVIPLNAPVESWELMHDDIGRLVPYVETGTSDKLDYWLVSLDEGMVFTTQQAHIVGEAAEVSRPTVERWLKNQITLGTIVRIDRGEYKVTGKKSKN